MSIAAGKLAPALVMTDDTPPPSRHRDYTSAQIKQIASRFALPKPVTAADFPEKGNINQHTFLITAGPRGSQRAYLLQRINHHVFTRPRHVMAAMMASIRAQKEALAQNPLAPDEEWHPITLVPTNEGDAYLELDEGREVTFWRLMTKIPNCHTYKSLSEIEDSDERLRIAAEVGRGLALYSRLTAGIDTSLIESPLPGYRDTRLYYSQLHSVLNGSRTPDQAASYLPFDSVLRGSTEMHFYIHLDDEEYQRRLYDSELQPYTALALDQEEFGMTLAREREAGRIRTTAIHGDTKIENFLFCATTRRVKAVVDLDTIMPHTWLSDWGDMVRSLVNVAGEKETDLSRVQVDQEIFEAVARGFLCSAGEIPPAEIDRMVDAVQIIALELGVRFLADYLRGDSYFKLSPKDPPDLNRTRAMVQLTLFDRLRAHGEWARERIAHYAPR